MKNKICVNLLVVTILVWLQPLSPQAQLVFNFTTTVGNGSFTLNTNNLVATGDNGSAAGYKDILDSLTFDGITYTNLDFSVYNNSFVVGFQDGFQILVDKSPSSSAARLALSVSGNSSTVTGIAINDLVTALSSFDVLKTSSFSSLAHYGDPNPPYHQLIGSVTSLTRAASVSGVGVHTNGFGFNVAGNINTAVVIEASTNISNPVWTPILTNTLTTGTFQFIDSTWTNSPGRLYRVRLQ